MAKLVKSIYTGADVTALGELAKTDQLEGSYAVEVATLSDNATIIPDFGDNQNFSLTIAGNRTLANPANLVVGQVGSIFVTQDGTGGRTLSYGSYWKFPGGTVPTLSTAPNAVDRIDYIVKSATEIHAVFTGGLA